MAKKRRQHEHEEHIDESWLIPYADLLTLLLALFIVLFASSSVDAHRFNEMMSSFNSVLSGGHGFIEPTSLVPLGPDVGKDTQSTSRKNRTKGDPQASELQQKIEQETKQLEDLKSKIDQYFKDNGLDSQLSSELNNFQLAIRISDNALFTPGSADVKQEARKLAQAISDLLVEYPQYQVVVSGHTDTTPINNAQFRDNWDLSAARSLNFMKIMLENKQLEPSRFSSVGYGEYQPVQPNTTAEGKSANRRVEVSIMRTIIEPPAEQVNVTN
jgi:chemotaxis protein MotB